MVKKLKFDKKFAPCPTVTGDELFPNGIFVFNITKLSEFIQENPESFDLEEVAVSSINNSFSSINESHIDLVDISKPLILAEISPGRFNLIDGNHRLEKARRMGVKFIQVYRLSVEQHIRFLTSEKAYVAYIEYWNSKVKEEISS